MAIFSNTDEKKSPLLLLKRARVSLQKEKPFFSDLIFYLKFNEADSFPSMAVDPFGNLYFNAEWVGKLTEAKLKGVMCHEVLHLAFLHIPRAEKFAADEVKQFVWNLAIDCQANYLVKKNNMELPDDVACRPDNYGNSVHIDLPFWKYEVEDIESKSAEKIYYEIYDKIPKAKARAYAQGFKGKPIRIGFDYHLDKKGQGQKDGKDGEGGSKGQGQGQELSKEDIQRIQQQWKDRLINALYRAQGIGNQPAGMDRWIKELLEPKIDWRAKLNRFVTEGLPFDYSFRRPHKRSEALGYYCPSYVNESLKVGVFIDTSGSIDNEELKAFKSECVSIAKSFECIEMVLGYLDTQMYPPVLVENGNVDKIMASMPKGGGGTDMRKVFKYIGADGWCADLELVVIFTDLDTPLPTLMETKGRKVLWVVPKRSEHYVKKFDSNIGEVVIIE
jgi:predicted metal-dependent peptidase